MFAKRPQIDSHNWNGQALGVEPINYSWPVITRYFIAWFCLKLGTEMFLGVRVSPASGLWRNGNREFKDLFSTQEN